MLVYRGLLTTGALLIPLSPLNPYGTQLYLKTVPMTVEDSKRNLINREALPENQGCTFGTDI